uniref:Uncharacterized protein n=1 Tax=Setaria italica TaxID=4555 RepID=K3ZKA3_SETIT
MAGSVGGEKREGRGSNPRPPTAHRSPLRRPGESTILSGYVACRMYLIMAVTGLGYLALTWSTVVLLGGFVTALQNKDFWCLTTISMLQAARSTLPIHIALPFQLAFCLTLQNPPFLGFSNGQGNHVD